MFAVLGLGEVVARAIGFWGTVYLARRLGADAYGIVAVAAAIVLYFTHVADFSIEVMGARTIAQDPTAITRLVPALLAARLVLAVACIGVLGAIGLLILPQPDGYVLAVMSLGLIAVAASTRFVYLGIQRPGPVAVARVVGDVASVALIMTLIQGADDLRIVPWTKVAGETLTALLLVLTLRRYGHRFALRHAPADVRPMFVSAAPLVAHAILGLAIFNSDLIFLRALVDARHAGMYAAVYTLISFLLNLGVTYGNSLLPELTRRDSPADQRALFHDALMHVITAALPLAAGGCLLAGGLISLVFGAQYIEAVTALQVLIWSIVVAWIRSVVQMGLIARDRQGFVLQTSAWSALVNLGFNLLLIPRYGMLGAAIATLATETLRTVIALVYSARLGLSFGVTRRLWRPVLATVVMTALIATVDFGYVIVAVGAGAVVYAAALLATGGIRVRGGRLSLGL